LQDAFNRFVSASNQRALFATIENESLVPGAEIPLQAAHFTGDLPQLQPYVSPTQAAYILLKVEPSAPDGYIAITFVPNAAPVRQKMLFASTRLTLARELGIERFRSTIFATEAEELTAEGWAKHEKHEALPAPMTTEEAGLASVKEAEARESQGTSTRRGHVNSTVNVPTGDGVLEALQSLKEEGCKGTLVQLKYQLPNETLALDSSMDNVSPDMVGKLISPSEPRYSFYSLPNAPMTQIVFIYTCPTQSKIKERMIYSTSKSWTRIVAERDAGVAIAKSLEATEPSEIGAELFGDVVAAEPSAAEPVPSTGFSRPKRPGRR
jgi:twinfilin-like protein